METTTKLYTPKQLHKFAKHFTGYVVAVTILVWGFTFAVMNVWWVAGALLMAMILGAALFTLSMTSWSVKVIRG